MIQIDFTPLLDAIRQVLAEGQTAAHAALEQPTRERGLLNRHDAARHLSISTTTLDQLVAEGWVPRIELPVGGVRFAVEDLDALKERFRRGGTPAVPLTAMEIRRSRRG